MSTSIDNLYLAFTTIHTDEIIVYTRRFLIWCTVVIQLESAYGGQVKLIIRIRQIFSASAEIGTQQVHCLTNRYNDKSCDGTSELLTFKNLYCQYVHKGKVQMLRISLQGRLSTFGPYKYRPKGVQ